jgi:benzoyl-CoA reductase/2-hydroxyglutaryl-CoA dehydratase subunit BcrC/BadD/HgdB
MNSLFLMGEFCYPYLFPLYGIKQKMKKQGMRIIHLGNITVTANELIADFDVKTYAGDY